MIDVRQQHVPLIERLEAEADVVLRRLAQLMEHAREQHRLLQDHDAEAVEDGGARVIRARMAYELRVIGRQLMRAHLTLVPSTDERAGIAAKALGWLDDGEREDKPWRSAA